MQDRPSSSQMVRQAIQAAQAGRRSEARDLLIQVVESDPQNETAWLWLSGLVDSLEDQIIACENALTINPANEKVRAHLTELQHRQDALRAKQNIEEATRLLAEARACAEKHDMDSALWLAQQAVQKHGRYEEAWLFIAGISRDVHQQIAALEMALQVDPSNAKTASALKERRYLRAHPLDAAARLEEAGKTEEALKVYEIQAATAKDLAQFDHIQRQILRIKRRQGEKIQHVRPASSIVRLSFPWPVLYLSLALVQMGLNPLKHPNFFFWLGLPLVAIGGYMLALAEVRSHHVIWQTLFHQQGVGSSAARSLVAGTGWFLILVPHVLLFLDALNRLANFVIPPLPF